MVRSKGKKIVRKGSRKQSSVRSGHTMNNSATRHGRSRNAAQGSRKTKKNSSSRKKRMTGRVNNKKNNNRRRDQQKKKKTTSVVSLISPTTSNLVRSDEEFHRESIFGINE